MKNTLTILAFLFGLSATAQDSLNTVMLDTLDFEVDLTELMAESFVTVEYTLPECPYNKPNAQKDIEKDSMSIIIHGGFTGFGNINEKLSAEFQQKYKVKFVYLGCMRFWNTESEDTYGYNDVIFAHLKRTYGDEVTKEFDQMWTNH